MACPELAAVHFTTARGDARHDALTNPADRNRLASNPLLVISPGTTPGAAIAAVHQAALLPILPCLIGLPVAAFGLGVVLPLWLVSLVLTGAAWCIVALLDVILRAAGSSALTPLRRSIERALHLLTHPRIPDRFRRG